MSHLYHEVRGMSGARAIHGDLLHWKHLSGLRMLLSSAHSAEAFGFCLGLRQCLAPGAPHILIFVSDYTERSE